jgi:hypothetical protein
MQRMRLLHPVLAASVIIFIGAVHITGYVQQQPDGIVARARGLPDR